MRKKMNMSEETVNVANFSTSEEAYIARNCFSESGIEASIVDEYMVAIDFRLEPALGGVKLDQMNFHPVPVGIFSWQG